MLLIFILFFSFNGLAGIKKSISTDEAYVEMYQHNDRLSVYEKLFPGEPQVNKVDFGGTDGVVDVGANLDCGQMDFRSQVDFNYQAAVVGKKLGGILRQVALASPWVFLCKMSPETCQTIQNLRLNASLDSQFNLNHCKAINKITKKESQFDQKKQKCIAKKMDSGKPFEISVDACSDVDRSVSWSGKDNKDSKAILSSLGANYDQESYSIVQKTVGDIHFKNGKIRTLDTKNKRISSLREIFNERLTTKSSSICSHKSLISIVTFETIIKKNNYQNHISYRDMRNIFLLNKDRRVTKCLDLVTSSELFKFSKAIRTAKNQILKASLNPEIEESTKNLIDEKYQNLARRTVIFNEEFVNSIPSLSKTKKGLERQILLAERASINSLDSSSKNSDEFFELNCIYSANCQEQ
jgi:hypothetical protein